MMEDCLMLIYNFIYNLFKQTATRGILYVTPQDCAAANTSSPNIIGSPRLEKSRSSTKQAYERQYP